MESSRWCQPPERNPTIQGSFEAGSRVALLCRIQTPSQRERGYGNKLFHRSDPALLRKTAISERPTFGLPGFTDVTAKMSHFIFFGAKLISTPFFASSGSAPTGSVVPSLKINIPPVI